MKFFLASLVALAATVPAHAADTPKGVMYAEGSINEAAVALKTICIAHPSSIAEQRRAAATAPYHFRRVPGSEPESYTDALLQLTVKDGAPGNLCAILTPFFEMPTPEAAIRDLTAKLSLGAGHRVGNDMAWDLTLGRARATLTLSFTVQGTNKGAILALVTQKASYADTGQRRHPGHMPGVHG